MDRLNRALAKAGQIAQQFNDDVQRAREQQQQRQAQNQLDNHRLSQQYAPQQHTQPYNQYQYPYQHQPAVHERPPPPPPRPSYPSSSPPLPVYTQSSSDYISKAEADLEQLKQQQREQLRLAEAEIARLRAEREKQQREAEREAHAARVEAEKLAASEVRRLQAEKKDAEEQARREVEVMQREAERLAAIEAQRVRAQQDEEERNAAKVMAALAEAERSSDAEKLRLQAEEEKDDEKEAERLVRQLEEDRKAAEKLAAEFDAELREAEINMERIKLSKEDEAPRPPLPPRISQQSSPSVVTPPTTTASPTATPFSKEIDIPKYLRPLPPMATDPPTQHISGMTPIKDCPGSAPLDITLEYLTHDAAPNFTICTRCYVDHIWDSPFKNSFTLTTFPTQEPRGCYFGVDRVKERLWPEAVEGKSLRGMLEYMMKRPKIAACPKSEEVEGRIWYQSGDCEGLAICPACYEERIVGGRWEDKFKAFHVGNGATCDMANTFITRMYDKFSHLNDWANFCKEAHARIRFPPCPKGNTVSGPSWFYPKNGPQGLKLCVGCFCDHFIDTPSEKEFVRVNDGSSEFSCSMGLLRIYLLAQEASRRKDHAIWWEKIHEIANNVPCDPAGTKSEKWYTLPSKPKGFAVCGGCVAGIVDPLSASSYFIPALDLSPNQPFLCAFNEGHPRLGRHLLLFLETILTGKDTSLSTFARKLSHVSSCPRLHYENGKHKTWWGWNDAPICEECYLTFAEGLHISPPFQLQRHYDPNSRMCDLYSPRMRSLYKTACSTGDFDTFLQLARERRQVYIDCYMPAQQYLQDMKIAALQAKNLGIQGTVYKSMGWSIEATQGHSYTLGNAAVGYGYENEFVFQGAVYDRQAADVRAQVMNPVKQAQMNELNNRWLAVE